MNKIPVGVLGATGMVGQRLVQMLENHPWFELTEVAASPASVGKTYADAISGKSIFDTAPRAATLVVKECVPGLNCRLVFSALDSSVAGDIETRFAEAGYAVSSNSRNHRMEPDVPLLIPEVNASHLSLIDEQKKNRGWKGFIVTNPNCSTIELCIALKPLVDSFGISKVMVTTLQALSGAGFAGRQLDISDNVIPYISGEEEKMEAETRKIFGDGGLGVSAQCNRVNVSDGHTESVSVQLGRKATIEEVTDALRQYNPLAESGLPTAPLPPITIKKEPERPQPKHDRMLGGGMTVSIGRIRPCGVLDYKFVVLGHNTIRGAAGAAILNAELMNMKGYL
jgi:aspartate-semialdehyde dehydrogenase